MSAAPDTPSVVSLAPADFTADEMYFVLRDAIIPRPIAWVSSIDAQGNKNRFDFTEASFPASVPATEWEFTPPAGTNITKN